MLASIGLTRAVIAGLAVGLILIAAFALCLTSALQILVPTKMPFGTTGDSQALAAVEQKLSLVPIVYANESDATEALQRGEIYGAFIPGTSGDTLLLAPAKSFFAAVELQAAFEVLDRPSGSPLTVTNVVPLPPRDRLGTVSGLLLLPTLIGGYLFASLLSGVTGLSARRRIAMLLGFSALGAVVVDVVAGPIIGAVSSEFFWPVLPCLFLATAAVSLGVRSPPGRGRKGRDGHRRPRVHRGRRRQRRRGRRVTAAGTVAGPRCPAAASVCRRAVPQRPVLRRQRHRGAGGDPVGLCAGRRDRPPRASAPAPGRGPARGARARGCRCIGADPDRRASGGGQDRLRLRPGDRHAVPVRPQLHERRPRAGRERSAHRGDRGIRDGRTRAVPVLPCRDAVSGRGGGQGGDRPDGDLGRVDPG